MQEDNNCKGLVTNYGEGGYKTGGGAREVLPLRKGGGGSEKVSAMLKGGHKKFWGSFYDLAILKGGCENFTLVERGGGAQ